MGEKNCEHYGGEEALTMGKVEKEEKTIMQGIAQERYFPKTTDREKERADYHNFLQATELKV